MEALVQPTKQARSLATQERILTAARTLLRSESFDAISIRQIVKSANTSIGSFYGRFRDKDALLPVLFAEYEARLERQVTRLRQAVSATQSLDELAGIVAGHFVDIFGENPNLSRAVFEYATRSPQSEESRLHSDQRLKQYAFLFEAILFYRDEINHSDPQRAAELSLYFVTVTCRNYLFYPLNPQTRTLRISKKEFKSELARLMKGYLRA